jgi:hypothetical protein
MPCAASRWPCSTLVYREQLFPRRAYQISPIQVCCEPDFRIAPSRRGFGASIGSLAPWNKTTNATVSIGIPAANSSDRHRTAISAGRRVRAAGCTGSNSTLVRSKVKTYLPAATTLALVAAVNFSPAMAQGPNPSDGNTWAGISRRVDTSAPSAATTPPHYEYQYGYDHHARWRGHWVLVR